MPLAASYLASAAIGWQSPGLYAAWLAWRVGPSLLILTIPALLSRSRFSRVPRAAFVSIVASLVGVTATAVLLSLKYPTNRNVPGGLEEIVALLFFVASWSVLGLLLVWNAPGRNLPPTGNLGRLVDGATIWLVSFLGAFLMQYSYWITTDPAYLGILLLKSFLPLILLQHVFASQWEQTLAWRVGKRAMVSALLIVSLGEILMLQGRGVSVRLNFDMNPTTAWIAAHGALLTGEIACVLAFVFLGITFLLRSA